jgi:hypothetical protein
MGHLAGDHVHLVGEGRGDDHVGIPRARGVQHVRMAREARQPLHVQRIGRPPHEGGVVVHHGDVVVFAGKVARDLPTDLARAADDDLHMAYARQVSLE